MNLVQRVRAEMLADKRKASILGGLALLAVVLGARAVILRGEAKRPSTGVAQPAAVSSSQTNPADLAAEAEARVRALLANWPRTAQTSQTGRDLFALNEADFPHPSEPAPVLEESAKLAEQTDDETLRREAFARDASTIRLKSTLVGKHPVAVLDIAGLSGGREALVSVGDSVNGFTVVAIESRRIVLQRDGERIELTVKSPME